jgi:hypothetical protein
MNQQQLTLTHQTASQIAPIDPTPIVQSESPTAVILAIAILLSILISGITGLVRVLVLTRSGR